MFKPQIITNLSIDLLPSSLISCGIKRIWLYLGGTLGILLITPFFIVYAQEEARVEKVIATQTKITAPFRANAIGLISEEGIGQLWVRFDSAEGWLPADDLILHENIAEIEWTACDPEKVASAHCQKNINFPLRITWIDTHPDRWARLKNWLGYRGVIRQIGGEASDSSNLDFKTRAEWGADENWRYASAHNGGNNERSVSLFSQNDKINQIIFQEGEHKLWWPLEYSRQVEKIVIHHTVIAGELADSAAGMRAIYLWHAREKDWGDIGYHFVIGSHGEIFVGRAGGDRVVGGHAQGFNIGTVSIAVLGDFENKQPKAATRQSLEKLIDFLARKYDINTKGTNNFHGIEMPNLLGHRDLNSTSCPGSRLYKQIVDLRGGLAYTRVPGLKPDEIDRVDQEGDLNDSRDKRDEPKYDFTIISGTTKIVGKVGDTLYITLILKNTGNVAWDKNTWLKSTKGWSNNYFTFKAPSNRESQVARMAQKRVEPGATALFRFAVELQQTGEETLDVFPVWGEAQPLRPIEIDVTVD